MSMSNMIFQQMKLETSVVALFNKIVTEKSILNLIWSLKLIHKLKRSISRYKMWKYGHVQGQIWFFKIIIFSIWLYKV